jgi:(p)ppGpp synthase/HD superfamily hydrolase
MTEPVTLGDPFDRAFALASELHRDHKRKSSEVPYISHLMGVAALVLEDGGDEEEAMAGLLHDALEDCAELISGEDLEERFGPRVRELVEACTDTPPDFEGGRKPDWKARKDAYIAHIASGEMPLRVSLADKVHNVRCLLRDHRLEGEAVWNRFSVGERDTLWFYRALAVAYRAGGAEGFLIDELERTADEVEASVRAGSHP